MTQLEDWLYECLVVSLSSSPPNSWCWSWCTGWSRRGRSMRRCVVWTSHPCCSGWGRPRSSSSASRCRGYHLAWPPGWACSRPRWGGWYQSDRRSSWGCPSAQCNHNFWELHQTLTGWTCWSSWRVWPWGLACFSLCWLAGAGVVSPRRCCWI